MDAVGLAILERELAADATRLATAFPSWSGGFAAAVRKEQGWKSA
jgi:hypothetical protein